MCILSPRPRASDGESVILRLDHRLSDSGIQGLSAKQQIFGRGIWAGAYIGLVNTK